ncbi:MAG: sugar phosphate isomerase/epimerase family protein [Bacteroidota bacterium]
MRFAFSTLGCPTWSWETVLEAASSLGYDGISLRGIGPVLQDLRQAEPFRPDRIEATKAELARRKLALCSVDTSVSFHDPDKTEAMMAAGRAHLDLAAALGVARIRVFGDKVPDGQGREEVRSRIAAGLKKLAFYAEPLGVDVLLETHGDFSQGWEVRRLMEMVDHPRVGVIWDIHHPFRHGGETPAETYAQLSGYIRAAHFKDSRGTHKDHAYCLLGQGDVPVRECLRLLKDGGYDGWIIFEWEKRWHAEIEEPEVAFPQFIREIRRYLAEI